MNWKKRLLEKSHLYVIVDKEISAKTPITDIVKRIKKSSTDIVQFRDKISCKKDIIKKSLVLKKLLRNTNKTFIINDYLDLAKIVDADGVHLGQNDVPLNLARKILGAGKIIGISCHNLKQALAAQKGGADYISIGPIFPTSLKPAVKSIGLNLIKEIRKKISIPFFAIGGINHCNIKKVFCLGAERIAVCRAFLKVKDDPIRIC